MALGSNLAQSSSLEVDFDEIKTAIKQRDLSENLLTQLTYLEIHELEELKQLIEQDKDKNSHYPHLCYQLGILYSNEEEPKKNDGIAVARFLTAAKYKLADAEFSLGMMYKNDRGISASITPIGRQEMMFKYFKRAADQQHPQAQMMLGDCYLKNIGLPEPLRTPQRKKLATELFRSSANNNIPEAAQALAVMLEERAQTEEDPELFKEAIRYYQQAADAGLADALFELGWIYHRDIESLNHNADPAKAKKYYKQSADLGHQQAQADYAWYCEQAEQHDEAALYYEKAIEHDPQHKESLYFLACLHLQGKINSADEQYGITLLKTAADEPHNLKEAQFKLGQNYQEIGEDILALEYLSRARGQGKTEALSVAEEIKKRLERLLAQATSTRRHSLGTTQDTSISSAFGEVSRSRPPHEIEMTTSTPLRAPNPVNVSTSTLKYKKLSPLSTSLFRAPEHIFRILTPLERYRNDFTSRALSNEDEKALHRCEAYCIHPKLQYPLPEKFVANLKTGLTITELQPSILSLMQYLSLAYQLARIDTTSASCRETEMRCCDLIKTHILILIGRVARINYFHLLFSIEQQLSIKGIGNSALQQTRFDQKKICQKTKRESLEKFYRRNDKNKEELLELVQFFMVHSREQITNNQFDILILHLCVLTSYADLNNMHINTYEPAKSLSMIIDHPHLQFSRFSPWTKEKDPALFYYLALHLELRSEDDSFFIQEIERCFRIMLTISSRISDILDKDSGSPAIGSLLHDHIEKIFPNFIRQ